MEVASATTATFFAVSKMYYALAALFTSMMVLFLSRTKTFQGHGRMVTGCLIGGTAVGSAVVFGGFLAVKLGMQPEDANTALAVGGAIGLFAFTVMKALVIYLDKMEGKDIVELAIDVKEDVKKVRKPAAKRVVKRKVKP